MEYKCAECGAAAEVKDGVVVRSCEHEGVVTASLSAAVHATSSFALD